MLNKLRNKNKILSVVPLAIEPFKEQALAEEFFMPVADFNVNAELLGRLKNVLHYEAGAVL
jgi:hypothetical protein